MTAGLLTSALAECRVQLFSYAPLHYTLQQWHGQPQLLRLFASDVRQQHVRACMHKLMCYASINTVSDTVRVERHEDDHISHLAHVHEQQALAPK